MPYPVKWFDNTQSGAPVLSGTAGALIALLDACLVNGFQLKTLDSITRADSVATATVSSGHGYREGDILLIAGANQAEYNGEAQIFNVTSTTFQFTVTGTPATPATGTISAKIAPVGWEKAYAGTNKAAYRASDLAATRLYLRVDDSASDSQGARLARVRGYETMTDVDTGSGLFPTAAQMADGLFWRKSSALDATARRWLLVGDNRLFYLMVEWNLSYPSQFGGNCFGDLTTYKAADAYHCAILGDSANNPTSPGTYNQFSSLNTAIGKYLARSYTQLGGAIQFINSGSIISTYLGFSGGTYPSPVDNGLHLHAPILMVEGVVTTGPIRGILPGLLQPVQNIPLTHLDKVTGLEGLPGRTVLMSGAAVASSVGRAAFDITGPWR